ncbi:unnamed protein product [Nippostrongylus brasiliensis]|uniref:Dynein_AAA_lid domain-containing protein n=1 Tax=Nippostrongylus brasiliensis TaxID=27835 RepID=A0A0N4YTY3_NIPBR|nr:unnamed protein product [Nippostrongylus brasiliensis]
MGDFVQVIGRERTDDDVIENFHMTFSRAIATLAKDWSFHPWILTLRLPMEAITSVDDMQSFSCTLQYGLKKFQCT